MSTQKTGAKGEAIAETYLKKQGYRIIERNFRCRYGEIDLIGYKKDILSFIEVKTRSSSDFGEPFDAIDKIKQKKLIKTANYYLFRNKIPTSVSCQFDVVSVLMNNDQTDIKFIPNAFYPSV